MKRPSVPRPPAAALRLALPAALLSLFLVARGVAQAPAVDSHGHPIAIAELPGGPAVELVETIPVETTLGDRSLPQTAEVWVDMIDSARVSVDLEHFYLSHWPGEPTGPVLDAIGRAAKRGVKVRLLLDVRFKPTYPQPADSIGRLANVELRWIDMKKLSGSGVQHAKLMIVDGRQLFIGSQNLDWRALKHIHELGVRLRDPRIAGLFMRVFLYDWAAAATQSDPVYMGRLPRSALAMLPLQLLQSVGDTVRVWPSFSPRGHLPDSSLWDLDRLVSLLDGARREVVAQVLTYGLGRDSERDSTLDQAIRRAAGRGVQVKLLVSDWEADNARIRDLQRLTQVPNIEVRLSSVADWSGGYIPFARVEHCKYMVVDSVWTWVGTSNWEPDYFNSSRNAALSMANRPIAFQARGIFETGWRAAATRRVTATGTYTPRVHRDTPPPGKKVYGK